MSRYIFAGGSLLSSISSNSENVFWCLLLPQYLSAHFQNTENLMKNKMSVLNTVVVLVWVFFLREEVKTRQFLAFPTWKDTFRYVHTEKLTLFYREEKQAARTH